MFLPGLDHTQAMQTSEGTRSERERNPPRGQSSSNMTTAKFYMFLGTDKRWHIDERVEITDVGVHYNRECAEKHLTELQKPRIPLKYECTAQCQLQQRWASLNQLAG